MAKIPWPSADREQRVRQKLDHVWNFRFRRLNVLRHSTFGVRISRQGTGFTIIELLVVVAIIALIAAGALAALSGVREKSRDARRLADIKSIQTAFDLYVTNTRAFPNPTAAGGLCLSGQDAISALLINASSIAAMPQDPLQNCSGNFHYHYTSIDGSTYTLSFFVEGGNVPGITNIPPSCSSYPCQKILSP